MQNLKGIRDRVLSCPLHKFIIQNEVLRIRYVRTHPHTICTQGGCRSVNFSELAEALHKYKKKIKVGEFVKDLTDAILEDVDGVAASELNPLYGLSKSMRESIYNGSRFISSDNAGILFTHMQEDCFEGYLDELSMTALQDLCNVLDDYGFEAHPDDVESICGNILAQIISNIAAEQPEDVTKVTIEARETGRRIKDIAPATIECRGNKLHISGEIITIPTNLLPENQVIEELKYVQALCEAYASELNKEVSTSDIDSLPRIYRENYKEQNKAYFSAYAIQHSVREVFDDGKDEFDLLEEDAWHGVSPTFWKPYDNGFQRLNAVLEKITNTTLDASCLSQIRNLLNNLSRMGICHILVNDGIIESWVVKDE